MKKTKKGNLKENLSAKTAYQWRKWRQRISEKTVAAQARSDRHEWHQ